MAQGPEARFKSKVNHKMPSHVHYQGMSLMFCAGTPDVYYEGPCNVLWVEYKFFQTVSNTVDLHKQLSALQQKWLLRASKNNVNVAVIVGLPQSYGVIYPDLSWQTPLTKTEFLERKIHICDISEWIVSEVAECTE